MNNFKSSLIVAALVSALGVSAASAASVSDLIATNGYNDRTAAGIAATEANIAALGVTVRKGDALTTKEISAIQHIVLDQTTFASKASRVDLVVNGKSDGFGNGYNIEW